MAVALFQLELVKFGLVLTPYFGLFRADNVEDDNLVLAFFQPASGHVERLLWTDAPEGGLLQVEGLVAGMVAVVGILAVRIFY